jgi:antitoxin ParD1/3/4
MNISLTPELERLVMDRVKSGLYSSASEVIHEALRLLDSHDRAVNQDLIQLRAEVDAGLTELEVGKSKPFDVEAVERIKRAGRAKLEAVKSSAG